MSVLIRLTVLLVVYFQAGSSLSSFAEEGPVAIPGSRVFVAPPEGFDPTERFLGFQQESTGSSLMVQEMPLPYDLLRGSMTAEKLATRGMEFVSTEEAVFGDLSGELIFVTQESDGIAYQKYLGVFGDSEYTVIVVGIYPLEWGDTMQKPMRTAVLSAVLVEGSEPGLFDGLDFRIEGTADLEISTRTGNILILTRTGQSGAGPSDPLLVVGSAHSRVAVDDLEEFSRNRIMQTAHVKNIENIETAPVTVDDLSGMELTARAEDEQSDIPMELYQVILLRSDSYFIVQGLVGKEAAVKYLPEFRKIVAGMVFID